MQYKMCVQDFCGIGDQIVVESFEDVLLGLKDVVLLALFLSFYLFSLSHWFFWNMRIILLFNIS